MSAPLDLTGDNAIEQGAYWGYQLTYKDGNGNPVDLTGWSARMQARAAYDASTVKFSLATAGDTLIPTPTGTITLGGVAGTILLELSATESAGIGDTRRRRYVYDLELVPPDGKTIRLVEGTVEVTPEVTR